MATFLDKLINEFARFFGMYLWQIILAFYILTIAIFLFFFHKRKKFFKPNKLKLLLLIIFSLFFPSLWYLGIIIGFVPAIFQLTIIFSSGFIESALTEWAFSFTILTLFVILLNFITALILNYLIICFLYKYVKNKNFLIKTFYGLLLQP